MTIRRGLVRAILPERFSRVLAGVRNRVGMRASINDGHVSSIRYALNASDDPRFLNYVTGNPVFSIPFGKLRYTDGRRYTADQHHFVRYYHDGEPSLSKFYRTHVPSDILQAFFLESTRSDLPPPHLVPWLALPEGWRPSGEAGLGPEHGLQQFGPVSPEKVRLEASRLDAVLNSIKRNGFRPDQHGYPQGYFLYRTDGDWAFIVRGGLHRVAALSYLEYPEVALRFYPRFPRFIDEADCDVWPLVRSGELQPSEARAIFCQFFQDSSAMFPSNDGATA
jgi:hypothetical protein